jgi:hypothetical protein
MPTDPSDAGRPTPLERIPTGIPGLDTVLRGGFLKAGIYIVRGEPGAGKTILGNQFCFNHVAAGHHAVYVTLLAETHDRMMDHMRAMTFLSRRVFPTVFITSTASASSKKTASRGLLIYCGEKFARITRRCSFWMDSSLPRRRADRIVISESSSTSFRPT